MASPNLQKLLRTQFQSASKIFTFLRQPSVLQTQIPQIPKPYDTTSFSNPPGADYLKHNHLVYGHFYPSFPFGFFLDPNPLIRSEGDDEVAPDESNIIRADSVKKKRKKKMNKHKLRKLRKCLRRKTKT